MRGGGGGSSSVGGGGSSGVGGGGGGRGSVQAARQLTRDNARLVFGHVFPLLGFAKGTRPAKDLHAKWELLGQFGVIVIRMVVDSEYAAHATV
jgi:hypothetical protein